MLKKHWKPLLTVSAFSLLVVGCSKEQEIAPEKESGKQEQAIVKDGTFQPSYYYKLDDKEVLAEVNGKKLTVGDLKEQTFNQLFLTQVNQFVEKQLLLKKYPISDEEVNKEIKKYGTDASASIDKEQIRLQIAYEKAMQEGVNVTDAQLKEIYDANFKNSGKTFKEMKDELRKQAPYFMGDQVYDKLVNLRTSDNVTFKDKELEKEINSLFVEPVKNKNKSTN